MSPDPSFKPSIKPSYTPTEEKYKERIKTAIYTGVQEQLSLEDRFYDCFHLNINWQRKDGRLFMSWLKDRPKGQTIEKFAEWWKTHDWRGKQGQPPSLDQIQTLWPQAFIAQPAPYAVEVY